MKRLRYFVTASMPRKRRKRRFDPQKDHCYMCEAAAASDEHAPARCFYPERHQGKKLPTVPACEKHNTGNSEDVEYVRDVFCIQYGTNATAEEVSQKAYASWEHSPKLFDRTFQDSQPAQVISDETVEDVQQFKFDLVRVKKVIAALAHALYYTEKRHRWPETFNVFCAFHSEKSAQGFPDGTEALGKWLCARPYAQRETLHPDVFEYQMHESDDLIFAMRFYGGPWIYAWREGIVFASGGHRL